MHRTLSALAIAALAASLALPAAATDLQQAPARVRCEGGRIVAITVLLVEAGIFTLTIPRDVCAKAKEEPVERPQPRRPRSNDPPST